MSEAKVQVEEEEEAYSVFSPAAKWTIVSLAGAAGFFSPVSSNIFVPAIPVLTTAFNTSASSMSLGVTVFLVFQAITPSFFGSLSDTFGRRPVSITTLLIYLVSNIGLAMCPTDAFWLLLLLRALQATGGSAVVTIGFGSVSDISRAGERGRYTAVFQAGTLCGPALGPVLGGLLAARLGWRSIFWFLTIATGVVLVPLIILMPETLRQLVGNGSLKPPRYCKAPIEIGPKDRRVVPRDKVPFKPMAAFRILLVPELVLVFLAVSLIYAEYYCILCVMTLCQGESSLTSGTIFSTVLGDTYHLTEIQIGLCYLPFGVGTILSSWLTGMQLDRGYARQARKGAVNVNTARIDCIWVHSSATLLLSVVLGWCLDKSVHLAIPLVCVFVIGLGSGSVICATVYGQDLRPDQGGSVSASLNLVRCALGAAGTSVIQLLYNALGAGWTFVTLSGICSSAIPLLWLVRKYARNRV